ncbi:MAG: hypothetical protein GOV00_00270, partial [Candidatus Altiarchaeota archaeon]|nr:hypothetical protein [Candidatus Altiarchaeota archaeon]
LEQYECDRDAGTLEASPAPNYMASSEGATIYFNGACVGDLAAKDSVTCVSSGADCASLVCNLASDICTCDSTSTTNRDFKAGVPLTIDTHNFVCTNFGSTYFWKNVMPITFELSDDCSLASDACDFKLEITSFEGAFGTSATDYSAFTFNIRVLDDTDGESITLADSLATYTLTLTKAEVTAFRKENNIADISIIFRSATGPRYPEDPDNLNLPFEFFITTFDDTVNTEVVDGVYYDYDLVSDENTTCFNDNSNCFSFCVSNACANPTVVCGGDVAAWPLPDQISLCTSCEGQWMDTVSVYPSLDFDLAVTLRDVVVDNMGTCPTVGVTNFKSTILTTMRSTPNAESNVVYMAIEALDASSCDDYPNTATAAYTNMWFTYLYQDAADSFLHGEIHSNYVCVGDVGGERLFCDAAYLDLYPSTMEIQLDSSGDKSIWTCELESGKHWWIPTLDFGDEVLAELSLLEFVTGDLARFEHSDLLGAYTGTPNRTVANVRYDLAFARPCDFNVLSNSLSSNVVDNLNAPILFDTLVKDVSRADLASSCLGKTEDEECILEVLCDVTFGITDLSDGDGDSISRSPGEVAANTSYTDEFEACYASSECLHTCNISVTVAPEYSGDIEVSKDQTDKHIGICTGEVTGVGEGDGENAELGNYISLILDEPTDANNLGDLLSVDLGGYPYSLLCDGRTLGNGGTNCKSVSVETRVEPRHTCYAEALARSVYIGPHYLDNVLAEIDGSNFEANYVGYLGCDGSETYESCRDCCDGPADINADVCSPEDLYYGYVDSGVVDECGVAESDLATKCYIPCGSTADCDGKDAGNDLCTEWCGLRENIVDDFGVRLFEQGAAHDDENVLTSIRTCKNYDVCFRLPFDPNCGGEGLACEILLGDPGHSILVGSEVMNGSDTNADTISFYESDVDRVIDDVSERVFWDVCQSDGEKLSLIPSIPQIVDQGDDTGILNFSVSFTLRTHNDNAYEFSKSSTEDFVFFTDLWDINQCDFALPCLVVADCFDYVSPTCEPLAPECNGEPKCPSNHICIDQDIEGAFFGVVLTESWDYLDSDPLWESCIPGDCGYTLDSCKGHFLGLEITQDTLDVLEIFGGPSPMGVSFESMNITLGGTTGMREYTFRNPLEIISRYPIEVFEETLLKALFVPSSQLDDGSFVAFYLNNGSTAVPGLVSVDVNDLGGKCPTGTDYGYETDALPNEGICYTSTDCQFSDVESLEEPLPLEMGTVNMCLNISRGISIGGYVYGVTTRYALGNICTNTCGDGVCNGIGSDTIETPQYCMDCCSEYGAGTEDSGKATTCFTHCGSDPVCDELNWGTVEGDVSNWDGAFVCGFTEDAGPDMMCDKLTKRTPIDEIIFEDVINITELSNSYDVEKVYEVWANYSPSNTIIFDLTFSEGGDDGLWDFGFLPEAVTSKLQKIYLKEKDAPADTAIETSNKMIEYTLRRDKVYGTKYLDLSIKQANRLPTNVSFIIHTMYESEVDIQVEGGNECHYRGIITSDPQGKYTTCGLQPMEVTVKYASDEIDNNFPASSVKCTLDSFSQEIELPSNGASAEGTVNFLVGSSITPGEYTLECTASGQNVFKASDSEPVTIYGRIISAVTSLPTEILSDSTYEFYITSVADERGTKMVSYSYAWDLLQNGILLPLSVNSPLITIPTVSEGDDLSFSLDVFTQYYHAFLNTYEVNLLTATQLSAYMAPLALYVPPQGRDNIAASLVVKNDGPTFSLGLEYSSNVAWITVNYTALEREFSGWELTEIPIRINVAEVTNLDTFNRREGTVAVLLSNGNEVISQASIRIIQTNEPYYEFDVRPTELPIDLIDGEVTDSITIHNVGTEDDSYVIDSDLPLSASDITLEALDQEDIDVTVKEEGIFELCVRSARLFQSKAPKCVSIIVVKKEVTPEVEVLDQTIEMLPGVEASFVIDITTTNYSGGYDFEFTGDLEIETYLRSLDEGRTSTLTIPFSSSSSGSFEIEVLAYPTRYPHKYDSASFTLSISFPAPFEADLKMTRINELLDDLPQDEGSLILQQVEAARGLIEEGKYDEALLLMEDVINQLERLEKVEAYKETAYYTKPYRSYAVLILGVLATFAGIFFYLR